METTVVVVTTPFRSQSAPATPSDERVCRAAAARNVAAVGSRRVSFPADEVTGIVEPPNPWEKAVNVTSKDVVAAYVESCGRYSVSAIDKVLQQVQNVEDFQQRAPCLDLHGEHLDGGQIEALEEVFKRVQFNTINLESTSLDDEGATALFDMIEYYESAQHLIISRNKNFNLRGWQSFCRMIKRTHCLGELEVDGIPLGDNVNILARTLKVCSNLVSLHLENCSLSGKHFAILMSYLMMNSSLQELYVGDNELSSTDAMQISNFLRTNFRLKLLHLGNNHLEDKGMGQIAEGLTDQSAKITQGGLSTLVVHNNRLSNKSAQHIVHLLADCKSLESLDIGQNNLSNEGIHNLKDALVKNRTLTSLSVNGCRITCEGVVALAEYIADNSVIRNLDLRDNNIKLGGLMALAHSMKVNCSVVKLELGGKRFAAAQDSSSDCQRQSLLRGILESCDRNYTLLQEKLAKEKQEMETNKATEEEVLSEPVTRLLSLWSNHPPTQKLSSNGNRTVSNPPPITISSIAESPSDLEMSTWQMIRGTSHYLRSPQPSPTSSPIPSPTRNRFRVTRVFQEAEAAAAAASANKSKKKPFGSSNGCVVDSGDSSRAANGVATLVPSRFGRLKFTVTPVKTINGLDATFVAAGVHGKVLHRKSDSDLLSSVSSSTSTSVSGTGDSGFDSLDGGTSEPDESLVPRRLDGHVDESPGVSGADETTIDDEEEEGEDSVFLDVPPTSPSQRVRHDSMRINRRRLSNGDDGRLPQLRPLVDADECDCQQAAVDQQQCVLNKVTDEEQCPTALQRLDLMRRRRRQDSDVSDHESPSSPPPIGFQNAMDSLDINLEKHDVCGLVKDILCPPSFEESVLSDSEATDELQCDEFAGSNLTEEEDSSTGGCGGDRDSGIYLLDTSTEELGTPHSEEEDRTASTLGQGAVEELLSAEIAIVDDRDVAALSPDGQCEDTDSPHECSPETVPGTAEVEEEAEGDIVSFNLVDVGDDVVSEEHLAGWTETDESTRCPSVDLLTDGSENWDADKTRVELDGDLMSFAEQDVQSVLPLEGNSGESPSNGQQEEEEEESSCRSSGVDGAVDDRANNNPCCSDTANQEKLAEVVSAWMEGNEWTTAAGHESVLQMSTASIELSKDTLLLQQLAPGGGSSESSNSSDSGVPESPVSCSPPIDPGRTSPSPKRKVVVDLTSLGERLEKKKSSSSSSVPLPPAEVHQTRGFLEIATDYLMPRVELNGASDARREVASAGCPEFAMMSPAPITLHGLANEAATT